VFAEFKRFNTEVTEERRRAQRKTNAVWRWGWRLGKLGRSEQRPYRVGSETAIWNPRQRREGILEWLCHDDGRRV